MTKKQKKQLIGNLMLNAWLLACVIYGAAMSVWVGGSV